MKFILEFSEHNLTKVKFVHAIKFANIDFVLHVWHN